MHSFRILSWYKFPVNMKHDKTSITVSSPIHPSIHHSQCTRNLLLSLSSPSRILLLEFIIIRISYFVFTSSSLSSLLSRLCWICSKNLSPCLGRQRLDQPIRAESGRVRNLNTTPHWLALDFNVVLLNIYWTAQISIFLVHYIYTTSITYMLLIGSQKITFALIRIFINHHSHYVQHGTYCTTGKCENQAWID